MTGIGVELELSILLGQLLIGAEIFAPFEVETPAWKKILKWSIVITITLTLYRYIGHWAALVPIALGLLGLVIHFSWCKKNDIHPIRATPRRRYYELRGCKWHE